MDIKIIHRQRIKQKSRRVNCDRHKINRQRDTSNRHVGSWHKHRTNTCHERLMNHDMKEHILPWWSSYNKIGVAVLSASPRLFIIKWVSDMNLFTNARINIVINIAILVCWLFSLYWKPCKPSVSILTSEYVYSYVCVGMNVCSAFSQHTFFSYIVSSTSRVFAHSDILRKGHILCPAILPHLW